MYQGYTIPLDKRLAADGRGLQSVHINENFAKLAEALYIADRKVSVRLQLLSQTFIVVVVFCVNILVKSYTQSESLSYRIYVHIMVLSQQ